MEFTEADLRAWAREYLHRGALLVVVGDRLDPAYELARTDYRFRAFGRGRTAGVYHPPGSAHASRHVIELHDRLTRDHARRTLGHELAHLVDRALHGRTDHGPRFRRIMELLGLAPNRCHDYDELEPAALRGATFDHRCRDCGRTWTSARVASACPDAGCGSPDVQATRRTR